LRKNAEISGWSLEGARLQAAPYIVFKDLRHGWEAVPFQNSNAESFSATSEAVPFQILARFRSAWTGGDACLHWSNAGVGTRTAVFATRVAAEFSDRFA